MGADFYDCATCGAGFGIAGGPADTSTWSEDDWAAQQHHDDEIRYHESRQCRRDRRAATKRRREAARSFASKRVEDLRSWRDGRRRAAEKRTEQQRMARDTRPRGIDRVPDGLRVHLAEPDLVPSKLGTYRGVEANYADRRAMGQRGHQRPPRRRELPGAEARRVERSRKAWSA